MTYSLSIGIATRNEAGQMRSVARDSLCEASQRAISSAKEKLVILAERIAKMEAKAKIKSENDMIKAINAANAEAPRRRGRPVGYKCNPETVRKMLESRAVTIAARKASHAPHVGASHAPHVGA